MTTSLGIFAALFTTCATALYFPQSDLSINLPFLNKTGLGINPDLKLLTIRTLPNDSSSPEDPRYKITSQSEKISSLDPESRNLTLHALPKEERPGTILVRAQEPGGSEAYLEIKIKPIIIKNGELNCTNFKQDICFWNVSKYRIYENQPSSILGTIGPAVYKTICPTFYITRYELLNGTEFFHLSDNNLVSNESLDRDTLKPPKGCGPHVNVNVRCILWDEISGNQFSEEKVLGIDILDQDDNPPIPQTRNVEIKLKDFTPNERLDNNELVVKDSDTVTANKYSVKILEDNYNALNITYILMSVENPKRPELPHSTVIYTRIFSRTTLLPTSPYRVILQIKDESLLPGYGDKAVNISLSFDGPQHRTTSTTTSLPLEQPVSFPQSVNVVRASSQYLRVAQPLAEVNSKLSFTLHGSKAFNITHVGGIIFVSNTSLLKSAPQSLALRLEWKLPRRGVSSTSLTVNIIDAKDNCKPNQTIWHSCANAETRSSCESYCGFGSGTLSEKNRIESYTGECVWRSNNAKSAMTEKYETCSPNLFFCPDNVCDNLEQLDSRLCPQDCTIESEVHFAEMNPAGRGIRSGISTCSCSDVMQCICGTVSERKSAGSTIGNKDSKGGSKSGRDRDKLLVVSDARKASTGHCGPACLVGVASGSIFVLCIIVGSFAMWRYRMVTKGSRRDCKHRGDGSNGLENLPLDYVDRSDGLELLSTVNRSLLLPKHCPDPKWEFPRSRLTIEQILGEGEFGRVLRAKATDIAGWSGLTTVAVKTLKEDASAPELADLLSEYQLLKEAQHPNVIRLLGACTTAGGPIYLIIEFAEFGSLRNYLRRSRHLESEGRVPCSSALLSSSPSNPQLELQSDTISNFAITSRDILSFAWQISKGMAYLADIKLVHRDLAARNVLLAAGKVCKISDFGLTRDVYEDDAYLKRSKGRVPVKWMAPESLADHVYTSKSDVWSFGVLLWELVTLGASPYPGVDVHNLYNLLKAGYRMEKPANCTHQLYRLMVMCWYDEPGMRPSFKELICHWERMLEDGVEYLDLNPRTVHNQAYFPSLHILDSPSSSIETTSQNVDALNGQQPLRTDAVNYLSKPSLELVTKCDKVDKLHTLWQQPISSFTEESKPKYANERPTTLNVNHYESPIRLRNVSVTSNSENELAAPETNEIRPHSYIDMQGNKRESEDLLSFHSMDTKIENGLTSEVD